MSRTREYILATLFYTALTLCVFYPVLPHFTNSLIGPPEDNMIFAWFLWHGSESLSRPDWQLMHTHMMYAPEGMGLEYANYFYVGVVLTYLLKSFLGLVTIFNLLILLSFITAGLAMYALVRYLTQRNGAALIAGAVFALNPSHIAHAEHHITIASIQFLPLVLLCMLRMLRENKFRWALLAGVSMALASWCDWNYLLYTTLLCGFVFAYRIMRHRAQTLWIDIKQFTCMAGVCFVLLAPILIPMMRIGMNNQESQHFLPGSDVYVADLWAFVMPPLTHWAAPWSTWIQNMNTSFTGNAWERVVYLGIANIFFVLVTGIWKNKATWPYFFGMLVFMAFSMGVSLHVGGKIIPTWMPYDVLEQISLFKHARNPSRIIVYAYLCLAVLVGFAWKSFFDSTQGHKRRRLLATSIALLIMFDFYQPVHAVTPVELPACYQPLIADAEYPQRKFLMLDIPWDGGRYAMYQTIHEIPNLQGYLGRKFGVSLIGKIPFDAEHLHIQKALLTQNKVKYVVFHKNKLDWAGKSDKERIAYLYGTHLMVQNYKRIYPVVYEDKNAVTFRVYE